MSESVSELVRGTPVVVRCFGTDRTEDRTGVSVQTAQVPVKPLHSTETLGHNVSTLYCLDQGFNSMKVTVTFGDTAVVVPCKTGWTVRDLIDQASRRYRRILEQVKIIHYLPPKSSIYLSCYGRYWLTESHLIKSLLLSQSHGRKPAAFCLSN